MDYFTERICKAMLLPEGGFKKEQIISFHNIRDVSGTSHMYSTSFWLPYEVAMGLSNTKEGIVLQPEIPEPAPQHQEPEIEKKIEEACVIEDEKSQEKEEKVQVENVLEKIEEKVEDIAAEQD